MQINIIEEYFIRKNKNYSNDNSIVIFFFLIKDDIFIDQSLRVTKRLCNLQFPIEQDHIYTNDNKNPI